MKIRNAVTALAAFSLVCSPVVAQAAPAVVEQARVGTEVEGEDLAGGFVLPLVVLLAAILAVVLVTDGSEKPVTPG